VPEPSPDWFFFQCADNPGMLRTAGPASKLLGALCLEQKGGDDGGYGAANGCISSSEPGRRMMARSTAWVLLLLMTVDQVSAQTLLQPAGLRTGARFGAAMDAWITSGSSSADATPYLLVGAPGGTLNGANPDPGGAFLFEGQSGRLTRELRSPDPQPGDLFGFSVFLESANSCCILVGAPGAGRAFHFVGRSSEVVELDASGVFGRGSAFGYAVTALGAVLTVGAPRAVGEGRVLTFPEYGTGAPSSTRHQQLLAPQSGDSWFGASLAKGQNFHDNALGFSSNAIAVGAPGDGSNPGAVYVYSRAKTSANLILASRIESGPLFGTDIEMSNYLLAILEPKPDSSLTLLHIYGAETSTEWSLLETVRVDGLPAPGGSSIWLQGSYYGNRNYTWEAMVSTEGHSPISFRREDDTRLARHELRAVADSLSAEYGAAVAMPGSEPYFWAIGDPGLGGIGGVYLDTTDVLPPIAEPIPLDTARFVPVANGNSWSYKITNNQPGGVAPAPWIIDEIVADTTINGLPHLVIQSTDRELDGSVRTKSTCAFAWPVVDRLRFIDLSCTGDYCLCDDYRSVTSPPSPSATIQYGRYVDIGGISYPIDAIAESTARGSGPGGTGGGSTFRWATDVGTIYQSRWSQGRFSSSSWSAELVHAFVQGREFGSSIVYLPVDTSATAGVPFDTTGTAPADTTGGATEIPSDFTASLYPNPARDQVTVAVALPSESPVQVEVFDLLGRRRRHLDFRARPQGIHLIRIHLADLPAATYLVRVRVGKRTLETMMLTRL
jgi:Secretion system C-terminal sorting domain